MTTNKPTMTNRLRKWWKAELCKRGFHSFKRWTTNEEILSRFTWQFRDCRYCTNREHRAL